MNQADVLGTLNNELVVVRNKSIALLADLLERTRLAYVSAPNCEAERVTSTAATYFNLLLNNFSELCSEL